MGRKRLFSPLSDICLRMERDDDALAKKARRIKLRERLPRLLETSTLYLFDLTSTLRSKSAVVLRAPLSTMFASKLSYGSWDAVFDRQMKPLKLLSRVVYGRLTVPLSGLPNIVKRDVSEWKLSFWTSDSGDVEITSFGFDIPLEDVADNLDSLLEECCREGLEEMRESSFSFAVTVLIRRGSTQQRKVEASLPSSSEGGSG